MAATADEWSYRGQMILAPMVRVNSLAFRTLCAEHGAGMLYSEEIVARSLIASQRSENAELGTVDFTTPNDGRVILRTRPKERIVLQLGTAGAAEALEAATCAAKDVRAVDLNMGCPVKFSLQGGMGSALLTEPEKVRDILTTLRRNLPSHLPVTCKIRLLDNFHDTLQLAKLIESCGVAAMAVHARRRHDRPRHWAQWDQFRLLRESLPRSLPLILNGDVFAPPDVPRSLESTSADSLMLGRGALWNPSIFAVGHNREMATQAEVVSRYVELARETQCPVGNAKYVAMLMVEGSGKTEPFRLFQSAKTMEDLEAAATACRAHPHFCQPGGAFLPAVLEPPPDLPDAPTLAVNSWRAVPKFWKPGSAIPRRSKAAHNRAAPTAASASAAPAVGEHRAALRGEELASAPPDPRGVAQWEHPRGGTRREERRAPQDDQLVQREQYAADHAAAKAAAEVVESDAHAAEAANCIVNATADADDQRTAGHKRSIEEITTQI
jgi:tRNA-dihydrouridine synthase 2